MIILWLNSIDKNYFNQITKINFVFGTTSLPLSGKLPINVFKLYINLRLMKKIHRFINKKYIPKPSKFHFLKNFTTLLIKAYRFFLLFETSENGPDPIVHPVI